jgi:hypothetical protein
MMLVAAQPHPLPVAAGDNSPIAKHSPLRNSCDLHTLGLKWRRCGTQRKLPLQTADDTAAPPASPPSIVLSALGVSRRTSLRCVFKATIGALCACSTANLC